MIRIWPGVVAVVLQSLLWFGVPIVAPDYAIVGILGAVVFGLVVVVWWLFFSRAPWTERIGAIVLMVVAVMINRSLVDPSIAGGAMGNLIYLLSIGPLCIALVVALLVSRNRPVWTRRVAIVTVSENATPESPPSSTRSAICRFCWRELVRPPSRKPLSVLSASRVMS